ncbi:MAG: hypothetical protein HY696_10305 [Deltaproteobacteria bacterium]|nr:hypothetical protein [Deltaproteobacteria bacterium]
MGTTSIRDVICGGLTEIANLIAPVIAVPKQELEQFCTALKAAAANDQVVIEQGWSKGALGLSYTSRFGPSHLLISDDKSGPVGQGHLGGRAAYELGALGRILVGGLLGLQGLSEEAAQAITSSPTLLGATQYLACLQTQGRAACAPAANLLQAKVDVEALRNDPGAEGRLANAVFAEAIAIWAKVENFLRAGRQADSDDSDLDKLDKIPLKYAAARPVIPPRTLAEARGISRVAHEMLTEFETNEALRSFVFDEGACKSEGCGGMRSCVFSSYLFSYHVECRSKQEDVFKVLDKDWGKPTKAERQ